MSQNMRITRTTVYQMQKSWQSRSLPCSRRLVHYHNMKYLMTVVSQTRWRYGQVF